jgi:hypothetical protein
MTLALLHVRACCKAPQASRSMVPLVVTERCKHCCNVTALGQSVGLAALAVASRVMVAGAQVGVIVVAHERPQAR